MEIPSIESITALHNALVQQRIDTAIMAKANDIAKARGEMALELLDAAAAAAAQSAGKPGSHRSMDINA